MSSDDSGTGDGAGDPHGDHARVGVPCVPVAAVVARAAVEAELEPQTGTGAGAGAGEPSVADEMGIRS